MKKQILLAIGVAALYAAAKEYGINSIDDLKKMVSPYLKMLDMKELANAGGKSQHAVNNDGY
jgi:hypothetical protein